MFGSILTRRRKATLRAAGSAGTFRKKMVVAVSVIGLGSLGAVTVGVEEGRALNPEQRDPRTLVDYLITSINSYWSQSFASWRYSYRPPKQIVWYNAGYSVAVPLNCDIGDGYKNGWITINVVYTDVAQGNAFYCPTDERIYLDYRFFLFNLQSGEGDDYGAGVVLAHEWGHHIQKLLGGYRPRGAGFELEADCFAGVTTRYGTSYGLLNANDVAWGAYRVWLWGDSVASSDPHGTQQQRYDWFYYGYKSYSPADCYYAYG